MGDIKKYTGGKNMGGVNRLEYCLVSGFTSIPEQNGVVVTGPVTFKAGNQWNELYCTKGSMSFEIDSDDSDNGTIHKIKITGNIPKLTPVIEKQLAEILEQKMIVRFWDNNRYCRIAGLIRNPLKAKLSGSTGTNPSNYNGNKIEIYAELTERVPYYYEAGVVPFPNTEDLSVL